MTAGIAPRSPRRQRGSVVVYTGITLLAVLTAAVIAIEMGRVYGAHQQLQKMASVAALDSVRDASRCGRIDVPTQAELESRVNTSLERNGVLAEITQIQVEAGQVLTEASTGRRFLDPTSIEQATAVRVTLRRAFPQLLTGLLSSTDRQMIGSATAEQPMSGAFQVGSGVASLNGGLLNAALGGLVGADLGLVDYTGLADVNVTLEQLATALDVEVEDLSNPVALAANAPLLGDSLAGLADALEGTANSTVIGLIDDLADAAQGNTGLATLDELIGQYDLTAPSAPIVNAFDLIFGLAAATRADPSGTGDVIPISVTPVVTIPDVATLAVGLRVLEPPQPGRGRPGDPSATATTAQVRLMIRAQVDALEPIETALNLLLLGGLLGEVEVTPLNLGIDVDVAKASATLERIDCPRSGVNNGEPIAQLSAEPAVATVLLGTYNGAPAAFPAIAAGSQQLLGANIEIVGGLIADIDVNVFLANSVSTTAGNGAPQELPLPVTDFERIDSRPDAWAAEGAPPEAAVPGNPQTVGSTNVLEGTMSGLFSSLNLTASSPDGSAGSSICLLRLLGVCTLSIPIDSILGAVIDGTEAALGAVLGGVGGLVDGLLDPLLETLGIKLGSATVIMQSVTTDQPRIATVCRPDLPSSNANGCPTGI